MALTSVARFSRDPGHFPIMAFYPSQTTSGFPTRKLRPRHCCKRAHVIMLDGSTSPCSRSHPVSRSCPGSFVNYPFTATHQWHPATSFASPDRRSRSTSLPETLCHTTASLALHQVWHIAGPRRSEDHPVHPTTYIDTNPKGILRFPTERNNIYYYEKTTWKKPRGYLEDFVA